VVGCEPGDLKGVIPVDPAQLDDGLSSYLGGARGPVWSATFVDVDDRLVLIVVVEPPKDGDPIFTLRKTYQKYSAGTVFVRSHGKTAPADDHDMDRLQARLQTSSANSLDLVMSVVGDVPLSWFDPSRVEATIQEWVEGRRAALIAEAERIEHSRSDKGTPPTDPFMATQRFARTLEEMIRLSNPLVKPDERTLQDYTAEVEAWAERLMDSAKETWPGRYLKAGHGVIRLRVVNPTDRNLRDVLVKATLRGEEVTGLDELPFTDRLPSPPRKYGEPIHLDFGIPSIPIGLDYTAINPIVPPMRSTWVEEGSVRISWAVGDLRPRETDESDDIYVFVRSRPAGGILAGVWEATSKSTEGVLKGELAVPVAEEPVAIAALFEVSDAE